MKRIMAALILCLGLSISLFGCTPNHGGEISPAPSETNPLPTASPEPTVTPDPTVTPEPSLDEQYTILGRWQATLTQKNALDTIAVLDLQEGDTLFAELTVFQGNVPIWAQQIHQQSGVRFYFLYQENDKDYLLEWTESVTDKTGKFDWRIFSLDLVTEQTAWPKNLRSGTLTYDASSSAALMGIDLEEVRIFEQEVLSLMSRSKLLAGFNNGEFICNDSQLSSSWQWSGVSDDLNAKQQEFLNTPTTLADLPSHGLTLSQEPGSSKVLLSWHNQTVPLDTYIDLSWFPVQFYPADRNGDGADEIVILYHMGHGTGTNLWGLMACWIDENGAVRLTYHDWQPLVSHFKENNLFTFDPDTNALFVTYDGYPAFLQLTPGELEPEPGWDMGTSMGVYDTIMVYETNSDHNGWRLTTSPCLFTGPSSIPQSFDLSITWEISFDGTQFYSPEPGILTGSDTVPPGALASIIWDKGIVTVETLPDHPNKYYLVAEYPSENISLFAKNNGADGMLVWGSNSWQIIQRPIHTEDLALPAITMEGNALIIAYPGEDPELYFLTDSEQADGSIITTWEPQLDSFVLIDQKEGLSLYTCGHAISVLYDGAALYSLGGIGIEILDFQLSDLNGDDRNEVIILGGHYDAANLLQSLTVVEQIGGGWTPVSLFPGVLNSYKPPWPTINGSPNATFSQNGDMVTMALGQQVFAFADDGAGSYYLKQHHDYFFTAEGEHILLNELCSIVKSTVAGEETICKCTLVIRITYENGQFLQTLSSIEVVVPIPTLSWQEDGTVLLELDGMTAPLPIECQGFGTPSVMDPTTAAQHLGTMDPADVPILFDIWEFSEMGGINHQEYISMHWDGNRWVMAKRVCSDPALHADEDTGTPLASLEDGTAELYLAPPNATLLLERGQLWVLPSVGQEVKHFSAISENQLAVIGQRENATLPSTDLLTILERTEDGWSGYSFNPNNSSTYSLPFPNDGADGIAFRSEGNIVTLSIGGISYYSFTAPGGISSQQAPYYVVFPPNAYSLRSEGDHFILTFQVLIQQDSAPDSSFVAEVCYLHIRVDYDGNGIFQQQLIGITGTFEEE